MNLEQSIRDFYRFLCQPIFNFKSDNPLSYSSISLMFVLLFIVEMILAGTLFSIFELDESPHKLNELFEKMPLWQIFLMAVIIAPLLEEFVFRAYLRYPSSLLVLYLVISATGLFFMPKEISMITLITIGLVVFVGYILIQNKSNLTQFFKNQFGYIFYLSVIIFAYVHIFNFESIKAWYLVPIMVLPQFVLALFLGYVRVRNNIWASIYVHALNNLIPMTLFAFGSHFTEM